MQDTNHSLDHTETARQATPCAGRKKKDRTRRLRLTAVILLGLAALAPRAKAQFELEESHTKASLRGVYNVGKGTVWASGTHGTVLRSEDDGFLWQNCPVPPGAEDLDFRGIQAWDANTAIVMSSGKGDQSRLYKTTDGCQTWKLIYTNPDKDGFFDALQFSRWNPGFILGDPVNGRFILKALTGNLKNSDSVQSNSSPNIKVTDIGTSDLAADPALQGAFAASNSSLVVNANLPPKHDANGQTYFIADAHELLFGTGGKAGAFVYLEDLSFYNNSFNAKWNKVPVPIGTKTESSGIFSLALNHAVLLAVGGDYKQPDRTEGTVAFSTDGGKTWQASHTPPHGYRSAVAWDADQKFWIAVGPNGTDISTDDGKDWRPLRPTGYDAPDADKNWNALSLPFVVGSSGRIGRLYPIHSGKSAAKP